MLASRARSSLRVSLSTGAVERLEMLAMLLGPLKSQLPIETVLRSFRTFRGQS